MKKLYLGFLFLAATISVFAQTPSKKWQGASSDDWDIISANWIPTTGLPFPKAFVQGDDVILDDSRNAGKDTIKVAGAIKAANISVKNTIDKPYYILAKSAVASDSLYGTGAIYKENDGEIVVGVNNKLKGGVIVRGGYYTADNPGGTINAFGPKVTFEGGGIKIHRAPVDNPTFTFKTDIEVAEGKTGEIFMSRRVNLAGKVSGAGTLTIRSNGERDYIDLTGGADWTGFTGQVNVVDMNDERPYTSGFYGLILQTDSVYTIEIDSVGDIKEKGLNTMLSKTKINLGPKTTMGTWSGNRCFQIGELTSTDTTATIWGYVKKSTSPQIYYNVGSANTNFTLSARFTGEQDKGTNYRRYNVVALVKSGTGTMKLTNGRQYITGGIFVLDGKLFISNPEGSSTGTGWLNKAVPLVVGKAGVLGGTGSISRNIDVWGKIAPGEDAIGKLTVRDSLNVADSVRVRFTTKILSSGTLEIELGTAANYDVLVSDSIITDGALQVKTASTYDLKAGDSFKIIDAAYSVKSLGFAKIQLPGTDKGWVWDTSKLEVDGTITLTTGGGSGTTVSVKENAIENQIKLFPNPNNGNFRLEMPNGKGISLSVFNSTGTCIYNNAITSPAMNLSLRNFSKGLYFVKINTTEGMVVRKMLIQE